MTTDTPALAAADDFDDGPTISLLDLLTWLGEGKKRIVLCTMLAAAAAIGIVLTLPSIYTARTTLLPPGSQQQSGSAAALAALGSLGGLAGGLTPKTPDELYISLLKSDTVQRALANKFDLYKRYQVTTYEAMRKVLPQYVRITSDKKSGLITVEVDDKEPDFAAQLANAHAGEISKLLGRLAVSEAQQRRAFFDLQLKETKENLIKAEQSLREVQEKSGMVVLDKQAEAIITGVAQLKASIAEREVRLKVLRTSATAENPDVIRLNSELGALRSELSRAETAQVNGAENSGGLDMPVGKLPAASIDYIRARREIKFQETMLESMLRQFEVAKLDEAKEGPALQQVDVAQKPDYKSKPSRATFVLAITLLAFLGSSIWVITGRYRRTIHDGDPSRAQAWRQLARAWKLRG